MDYLLYLFGNTFSSFIFRSKMTVYTAEKDQIKYFDQNQDQVAEIAVIRVRRLSGGSGWCTVVQWLSLLHNFIQVNLNSGYVQVQSLLTACRRFAMVRISDNKAKRLSSVNHTAEAIDHNQVKSHSSMCKLLIDFLAAVINYFFTIQGTAES